MQYSFVHLAPSVWKVPPLETRAVAQGGPRLPGGRRTKLARAPLARLRMQVPTTTRDFSVTRRSCLQLGVKTLLIAWLFPAAAVAESASGDVVSSGSVVNVRYTLWLGGFQGRKLDSGRLTFRQGAAEVVKGFDAAVLGMRRGEVRRVTIPPEQGYGHRRVGPIPPDSTLYFEVELLSSKAPDT
ncbi:hypothetical protein CDCA_CDCA11G3141 [Cyanidium caldarium]|uniref:peptidylprolyl isomerase n=1 Tax=Cyanidium caldarium TaxID=2771 RepID=A0AAV9IYF0_CYACA|nr:hypothetical protein CDCA_CDCA11G3141 [Cyanidium caldarium]